MSKLATTLIATTSIAAVGGAGFAGYKMYNNSNNSNTNTNVAATNSNTKANKSIKSELLGTWVQTFKTDDPDNPKNKIEFTADEMISSKEMITYTYTEEEVEKKEKRTETYKQKYKIVCEQFLEVKDESDAASISKFTIEGDELTIFGKSKDSEEKFKRESSNTAANTSTDAADPKTEESALNKKDLVGTWNDTEKPEFKYVFTEDQMTAYNNGEEVVKQTYKLPCGQILESTDERGSIHFSKVAIERGEMTLWSNGQKTKLRREGGNAANETADENLTEEVKVFKHKLTGTWKSSGEKIIFTNDGKFLSYDNFNNLTYYFSYRFIDDQTVEWNSAKFERVTAKMTLEDNNKTLVWENLAQNKTFDFNLESENADVNLGDSLKNNVFGNWVGIAGTNSADERISVYDRSWAIQQNNGNWNRQLFSLFSDGTVYVGDSTYKVTVADDVMTTEAEGVVKKYNRLKTVVDK